MESTAGFATGCKLSAMGMPISQAHVWLGLVPLEITSSPVDAPSGTLAMRKESDPTLTARPRHRS
jgi:hypothetical protein